MSAKGRSNMGVKKYNHFRNRDGRQTKKLFPGLMEQETAQDRGKQTMADSRVTLDSMAFSGLLIKIIFK